MVKYGHTGTLQEFIKVVIEDPENVYATEVIGGKLPGEGTLV